MKTNQFKAQDLTVTVGTNNSYGYRLYLNSTNSATGSASGNGFYYTCLYKGSNSYTDGETVWYNYAAATAGTITGPYNNNAAEYDICPAGWKLPTQSEIASFDNTYISTFNPVFGGSYYQGNLGLGSTAYKANGFYIRCTLK